MGKGRDPRVVAVILTYNRREVLRRCLLAIRAQTIGPRRVIVVDNASTDGTAEMVRREFPEADVLRLDENTGCTGGYHAAVHAALSSSCEFLWLFDDDAMADAICLETLLAKMAQNDRRVGVLRTLVQDPVTRDMMGAGFSHGALLRAEMLAAVPLPPKDLFMEFDDKIYTRFIRHAGYEVETLPTALVQHPVRRRQTLLQIVREGYHVNSWRLYYGLRNRIYFSLYLERSIGRCLVSLVVGVRAIVLLTLFGRPKRGQMLLLRGMVDGLRGRLGRRVAPAY